MEAFSLSLLATLAGFAVPVGMGVKLLAELTSAWRMSVDERANHLELMVNGKDYSFDIDSVTNGGSDKLRKALAEMEHCN
jgi:hypothetical protein